MKINCIKCHRIRMKAKIKYLKGMIELTKQNNKKAEKILRKIILKIVRRETKEILIKLAEFLESK